MRIAVDDFGTGYSSLAYLKRFPLDILKIARSFVMESDRDADGMAIPRAVISFGRSLGLSIVAEGVERQGQFEILRSQGCDEFQGYLFSRCLAWLGSAIDFFDMAADAVTPAPIKPGIAATAGIAPELAGTVAQDDVGGELEQAFVQLDVSPLAPDGGWKGGKIWACPAALGG